MIAPLRTLTRYPMVAVWVGTDNKAPQVDLGRHGVSRRNMPGLCGCNLWPLADREWSVCAERLPMALVRFRPIADVRRLQCVHRLSHTHTPQALLRIEQPQAFDIGFERCRVVGDDDRNDQPTPTATIKVRVVHEGLGACWPTADVSLVYGPAPLFGCPFEPSRRRTQWHHIKQSGFDTICTAPDVRRCAASKYE